jgi:uncharacterized protein (TIGR02284 family)
MDKDDLISTLNDLIETSKDGEQGFRTCAENVSNMELQEIFTRAAARCAEGARELQREVGRLGGDVETHGSVAGSAHRAWVDIKAVATGKDDEAILNEAERGEDSAKDSYSEALEKDLPPEIRAIVARQYQGVLENHKQVRDLRNRYRLAS